MADPQTIYAEIDEKEFLFLLQDYRSEDFKKARRNLIFASYIILIISILNKSLTEVRIFGLDLAETNHPKILLWLALALIGYWAGMVLIFLKRDGKAHSE